MQRVVEFSPHFDALYRGFPTKDQDRIDDFTEHFVSYGLIDLPGKIAPSWKVPGTDPDYYEKQRFAREHRLWHYHVGIPVYTQSRNGNYHTSDWVVHFQRHPKDLVLRLVDYGFHRPMHMPKIEYL
ncbi:hypothetical protein [Stutzerimonas nitrititolerans]|uniref:hypothetical protein n=1 Tax=Stutzerimonas nitrititolerans TaxID=2482751 RepID=UPI0028A6DBB5|nr:hypothetical protein [Stutzerimonas nitrititolerans]